jgi:CRISPR-associated endonuclease/helicase Cas3
MPMDPARLWAKSKRDDEPERPSMFLPGHLEDVYQAAERVLVATADNQLHALGLDAGAVRERLRRVVLLASAVHDLGKANDHFQGMIRRTRNVHQNPQGLRHEWVTVLMLRILRDWLLPAVGGDDADFAIVEWAVAGHHPAVTHPSPPKETPAGAGADITLLMGHPDFTAALRWFRTAFGLAAVPTLADQICDLADLHDNDLGHWSRDARRTWRKMAGTPIAQLVAAAKNCLIAADVAGSALPRVKSGNPVRWDWITESFADRPKPGDLQTVVEHRLGGGTPRAFQTAVASSAARVTFVKAGCGSGKTLAAYMWAAANHPTRRLYFCYPTTGTATEGFRDYLFDEAEKTPRVGADLFHGRSEVDFDIILNTGADGRGAADEEARLDALRAWNTPVVACTVDTVLGVVQNNRRGLFGWPALAQAAFVFDEIHAFDDKLFGALLRFLRDLPGLPVLLMTASLPAAREEALRSLLGSLDPIPGPADLEDRPRYRKAAATGNDPLPLVRKAVAAGPKVLWVCNTVGRVMDAAGRAEVVGLKPLLYHSRFKYEHRVQRHSAVIAAYKGEGPALAICSQVAEMSLDLSADLLVTDLAPVPALIQRLGRLNRRAEADTPTKPFVVVEPDGTKSHLPYTPEDLEAARAWVARLADDGVSQRHLAVAWEQTANEVPVPGGSAWLDGGPETNVVELRDGSPGVTVLMHEDLPRLGDNPKHLTRLVLPMPACNGWEGWPRERGLPVAPAGTIIYDPMRGAEWRK